LLPFADLGLLQNPELEQSGGDVLAGNGESRWVGGEMFYYS